MSAQLHTWTSEIVQHKCPTLLLMCFVCPTTFKVLLNSTSGLYSSKQNVLLKLESFQPFYYSCPSEDAGVWFCFCHWTNCWDTSGPHTWAYRHSVIHVEIKLLELKLQGRFPCHHVFLLCMCSICLCVHLHTDTEDVCMCVFFMNC